MTDDQFTKQTGFIASVFTDHWTYEELSLALGSYSSNFTIIAPFRTITDTGMAQVLVNGAFQPGDNASLTT